MQQTTCGEIPKNKKTKVHYRKSVDNFIEEVENDYSKFSLSGDCLYQNAAVINDPVANFLNIFSEKNTSKQLKFLIGKEFNKLERKYPKMGSIFVEHYFDETLELKGEEYVFHKENKDEFVNSLIDNDVKNLTNFLFDNASLEYSINIESSLSDEIVCVKTKDINFRIKYDADFLGSKSKHVIKNYRYIIIDGYIQSIGEIYHVLYKAAESKEPYVIFCFGVSDEVKDVIIQNNSKGLTEIMPVSLSFDENTINILNDLSILLNSDVVSAKLGQTISQEIRKDLPVGQKIQFDRGGFILTPNIDSEKVIKHKKFLEGRIRNSSNETNRNLLIDRSKRMSCKTMNIFIPQQRLKDNSFVKELDYVLRFLINSQNKMIKIFSKISNKTYFIPEYYLTYVKSSKKSLKKIYENLDKIILWEEDEELKNARN